MIWFFDYFLHVSKSLECQIVRYWSKEILVYTLWKYVYADLDITI
jgi:hypothetical protein